MVVMATANNKQKYRTIQKNTYELLFLLAMAPLKLFYLRTGKELWINLKRSPLITVEI